MKVLTSQKMKIKILQIERNNYQKGFKDKINLFQLEEMGKNFN